MKIENKDHMVIIHENLLSWYDEETDALFDTCPVRFENGKLIEITEDFTAIEKEEGFRLEILDGVGNVEKTIV